MGIWVAECPGCVNQGRTHEEAVQNIREAITLCLEVRAEFQNFFKRPEGTVRE
jgi:predicted RNase H-like HicB family nuclease